MPEPCLPYRYADICSVHAQICKTEVYDINHGHKTDLATSVEKSARILSSTRGTKDRFKVCRRCPTALASCCALLQLVGR